MLKAITHTSSAGDKVVELVAWLERGAISVEEELLEALSAAPLPRKGANPAGKPAPAAGAEQALFDILRAALCLPLLYASIMADTQHSPGQWHGMTRCPVWQMLQSCAGVMCLQMQLTFHCPCHCWGVQLRRHGRP